MELASELGVEREDIDWLRLAALLHDIGKIGMPDFHPEQGRASLIAEAIEKMKDHPVVGARILEHIERYREMAGWIRHHHEHFDGTDIRTDSGARPYRFLRGSSRSPICSMPSPRTVLIGRRCRGRMR